MKLLKSPYFCLVVIFSNEILCVIRFLSVDNLVDKLIAVGFFFVPCLIFGYSFFLKKTGRFEQMKKEYERKKLLGIID